MSIENTAQLRAALREYFNLRENAQRANPIRELERALIGTKIPGYFPTPKDIAEVLVNKADIRPGMRVLEPSAGKGNLCDAIKQLVPAAQIVAIEPVGTLRKILEAKCYQLVGYDVFEHEGVYDRVVMNPPFENGQDIAHIRKAYELLSPGGRLIAIMSEGPFFREISSPESSEYGWRP
jgi:predicted RNA methylase